MATMMTPKDYAEAFWQEWLTITTKQRKWHNINIRQLVEKYIQQAVDAERKPMPCGHPHACLVWVSDELRALPVGDATHYCSACAREAHVRAAAVAEE
jgi:hypothetical protein